MSDSPKHTPKAPRGNVRRKRLFVLLASVLGLAMAGLLGELSLRTYVAVRGWTANCYATGLVFFVPHPASGHTLRPHLKLQSSTYDIAVNASGFRGPELRTDASSAAPRIVVLGGSSVFGYLVGEGLDSCRLLETRLQQQGVDAEVINAGVPGFNLRQCRLRYEQDIAQLNPDYVLLYLGWNDSPFLISATPDTLDLTPPAPPWLKRTLGHSTLYGFLRYRVFPEKTPQFAPPASRQAQVTDAGAAMFDQELELLVQSIRDSDAQCIISTQVMAASEHCRDLDAFLGSTPDQVAANRVVGQWITDRVRNKAVDSALPLVDCAASIDCDSEILGDAIHLTEAGHRQVADAWFDHYFIQLANVQESTR